MREAWLGEFLHGVVWFVLSSHVVAPDEMREGMVIVSGDRRLSTWLSPHEAARVQLPVGGADCEQVDACGQRFHIEDDVAVV